MSLCHIRKEKQEAKSAKKGKECKRRELKEVEERISLHCEFCSIVLVSDIVFGLLELVLGT